MKKIFISLAVLLTGAAFTGCNDDFLEKYPITQPTEATAFKSYDNFKAFMWPCYNLFTNTSIATSANYNGTNSHYNGDVNAGYLEKKYANSMNPYAFQNIGSVASGNGWDFTYIRRVNMMLAHLDEANMTETEKNHWKAVGYFFHSFWYMELINRFGDVPWVEKVLNESTEESYGPRESRVTVANKVLERLKWAETNIGDFTNRDGDNTITQDVVLAAISRFTIREATWRKYHELEGADAYFTECIRASKLLMERYPTLYYGTDGQPAAGYGEVWTSDDLSKVPGVILYKEYVPSIMTAQFCHWEHTSSHDVEMNQNTVNLYLMKNGKPITHPESGYHGDKNMYATFRDRDPRLYHVVMPPYKVKGGKGDYPTWSFTGNDADREYMDIMGLNESCSNPGVGMKRLPGQNWSASLVPEIPRLGTGAFVTCRSGYYVWKNWVQWEENFNNGSLNVADKPIFKIEEVLLNYAEAMCETKAFTQDVANASINKLRDRAGVAKLVVADIDENFDTNRGKYYPKGNDAGILVDPLLWEVRRERIIELMGEGFGFYDIRRWRMAPWFLNRAQTGMWIDLDNKPNCQGFNPTLYNPETGYSDGANGTMKQGYVFLFNDPVKAGKGWLEKYYLYQVPTTEIVLNPELGPNNPGWE